MTKDFLVSPCLSVQIFFRFIQIIRYSKLIGKIKPAPSVLSVQSTFGISLANEEAKPLKEVNPMKKVFVGVGILVLLMGVGYVYAHGPWHGPGYGSGAVRGYGSGSRGGPCWGYGDFEKDASITPEQRTKFQELQRKFNDETAQLRTSIFAKRQELRSLWSDAKADSKAILQKEKELQEFQNQLRDKAIELKLESRKVLTPEQLSHLATRAMGPENARGPGRRPRYGRGPGPGSCY